MKVRRFSLLLFSVLFVLVAVSCSGKQSVNIPQGEQELPDMIMHEATYIFGQKDIRPLSMQAAAITVYSGDNSRTILENVSFIQEEEDENGVMQIELEGSCNEALVNNDNSFAQLSGNVRLFKRSDNFVIECEDLAWDDEKQVIKTNSQIHVVYEDGTELTAIGFSAQLDDNIYEFGKIVEGRFTSED